MQIGMIGLGRMGGNMARRLMRGGHEVVAYATDPGPSAQLADEGALGAASLDELVDRLAPPRAVWVMVPAGAATEQVVADLGGRMAAGDVIIDGGNSFYKDDVRRAADAPDPGHPLRGCGHERRHLGPRARVLPHDRRRAGRGGAPRPDVPRARPRPRHIAADARPGGDRRDGRARVPPLRAGRGAGHFVKMIHNGIEYGLMQAYAEGFDILLNAQSQDLPEDHRYDLPLRDIAEVWRRGSVVSSWLLDLTAEALAESPTLAGYTGTVQDSGEGRWTVMAAIEESVPADVLSASLFVRFRSRQDHTFAEQVLSAMRHKFGGHVERPSGG